MERVNLTSSLDISRIIYGMWRLHSDKKKSLNNINKKINLCLDQGITTFDQAAVYGGYSSEALFGKAIKLNSSLREKIQIVSKCGIVNPSDRYPNASNSYYDTSKEHIFESVEFSLNNLETDYLDLLLIHRQDPFLNHFETGDALDEMIESGKVKEVGVSNFRPHDYSLLQSGMKNALVTNQIEISLACTEGFTNGDIAYHQERSTNLMAWSSLGGGSLMSDEGVLGKTLTKIADMQGVDKSAVAIAWIMAHPAKICPIVGTNNLERISKLSDATKVKMDRELWFELYVASFKSGDETWKLP